jgi:hypothetical protein
MFPSDTLMEDNLKYMFPSDIFVGSGENRVDEANHAYSTARVQNLKYMFPSDTLMEDNLK